ncbi:MAG: hypothetical protein IJA36_06125 [Lachnospiraceae bacterium]|nr:hypothetical protein [Lachnospiraceae bacterium]
MFFKTLIISVLYAIVCFKFCRIALKEKKHQIAVGFSMLAIALLGLGVLADLPEEIKLSEFYKYYILFLLLIMVILGIVILYIETKDEK